MVTGNSPEWILPDMSEIRPIKSHFQKVHTKTSYNIESEPFYICRGFTKSKNNLIVFSKYN